MLNCDYKTISKVITNRIDLFLNEIIEKQQIAFMKARNIGDNLCLRFDIIDYANHEKISGTILFVDLHKPFDYSKSFLRSFIFATLKCHGFGNSLINWVRVLYNNPKYLVVNNNFFKPFSRCRRDISQDPLSPTIFVLYIECLAILLRQSRQYKGITLSKQTFKIFLFAGNVAIFLGIIAILNHNVFYLKI